MKEQPPGYNIDQAVPRSAPTQVGRGNRLPPTNAPSKTRKPSPNGMHLPQGAIAAMSDRQIDELLAGLPDA